MTKVIFKYDFDKDIENFIRGTRAKNSSKPTKLQEAYIAQNGTDYKESRVREFLTQYKRKVSFDQGKSVKELENNWRKIEAQFLKRVEEIFGISYPAAEIAAYLTTNQRCTYNIQENYFFVTFSSKSPNRTVMHELLHFYTWQAFHDDLIRAGINESQYDDIKESLTVLLNSEFIDLMGGASDDGYPQHVEMRKEIEKLWEQTKDLKKVVAAIV